MTMNVERDFFGDPKLVDTGEWAGWLHWPNDPYEAQSGPFYTRHDANGTTRCAFRVAPHHLNAGGVIHGGCLMTFADMALFAVAWPELRGRKAVTINLSAQFVGTAPVGSLVEATGDIVQVSRRLVTTRCVIASDGQSILSATAMIRRYELPSC